MHILLINHSLYTGGVETLIVRMANWLVRNNHECSILLRDTFSGDLTHLLDPEVNLRIVGNKWDCLALPVLSKMIWKSWNLPKPDIIYTMEQNWAVVGLLVRDLFPINTPSVATGAYHINQFDYEQNTKNPGRLALLQRKIYNHHYLDSQKVFMSEETRKGHEIFFSRSMPDGWVWPLPIKIPDKSDTLKRDPKPGKIISIGRLTRFKTYNWYMVPILRSLRERYPCVQWHIYGSGMCENVLVNDVWKEAIDEGLIFFHGPIPYEKMAEVFKDATAFIGMGTSVLEAAAAGVPTIPAIVDDPDAISWGFIDELPYFTVGETVPNMRPTRKVVDLLEEILESPPERISEISASGISYVSPYSEDVLMNSFIHKMMTLNKGKHLGYSERFRYIFIRLTKLVLNTNLKIKRLGKPSLRHPGGDKVIY